MSAKNDMPSKLEKLNHIASVVKKHFQREVEIGSLSILMFDRILRFQNEVSETGHVGEIGVNLGVTSGILSCYKGEGTFMAVRSVPICKKELACKTISYFSDIDAKNVIFQELTSANADLKV